MKVESISVVVPLYNEAAVLDQLLGQLRLLAGDCEIVLVDGGSTDGTYERLRAWVADEPVAAGLCPPADGGTQVSPAGFSRPRPCEKTCTLLHAAKGRGHQLNVGAQAAHGDILFFLHADSVLPPRALAELRAALAASDWGCFGIEFDPGSFLLRICAWWSNLRAELRRTPFGDQGVFLRRDLFWDVGGFPEIDLMEDYQLSLTLQVKGLRPALTKSRITTSSRRFGTTACGQLRVMCLMAQLRAQYRRGADPAALAARYRDAR